MSAIRPNFWCHTLALARCSLLAPTSLTPHSSSIRNPILCLSRCASNRISKRLEKLGIGPDGKPLPTPNVKKVFPRLYKVLMVNQDGSTYTIRHRAPHCIITLPLDLSTLTPEQLAERERLKQSAKTRVYVEEEIEDEWDQQQYEDLL